MAKFTNNASIFEEIGVAHRLYQQRSRMCIMDFFFLFHSVRKYDGESKES